MMSTDTESKVPMPPDLRKQLQKSLTTLKTSLKQFRDTEDKCTPSINTLMNLTEQYQCCEQVDLASLPKKIDSADLQKQLLYKITLDINSQIDSLQNHVKSLETMSVRLDKHFDHCMVQYRRHCCEVQSTQHLRTATEPSISDMLEWLDTSARLLHDAYLCKNHMVETYAPQQSDIGETFLKNWRGTDAYLTSKIEECLAMCTLFLEEPVT